MKAVAPVFQGLIVVVLFGTAGYLLFPYAKSYFLPPCTEALSYAIARYDDRFAISEAEFDDALADAATLWNEAAGRQVLVDKAPPEVPVFLVYGEVQAVNALGADIDTDQAVYEEQKRQVEALKREYQAARRAFERMRASFEERNARYAEAVAYWNARGGAPSAQYEELQREQDELSADQDALNSQVALLNALADQLNEKVAQLNALARNLNQEVARYNRNAGEDFDQGKYIHDATGARIEIYGFTDGTELRRVLAHEFGHALGLGHTENPDSIMYSYNIGEEFELSAEDVAELRKVCRLD